MRANGGGTSTCSPGRGILPGVGPAVIVAAMVLGPGSILTSSKVGCQYGYQMIWILAAAGALMIGMTVLAARLGVVLQGSLCTELAAHVGRPFAAFVGLTMFLIVALFQSGNNIAVIASIEPLLSTADAGQVSGYQRDGTESARASISRHLGVARGAALLVLNGVIVATLYGCRRLYRPIERMMMALVILMVAAFAANLLFSKPSLLAVLAGFVPRLPMAVDGGLFPRLEHGKVMDPLLAVQGLVATTFSIAGAFYQSYLVREKGWTVDNLRQGLVDSVVGISVLVAASAMIMITSASVLHGAIQPDQLNSAVDVASQLRPLFGGAATMLFLLGIFAAALSSFMVNAMVGGTLLADGLGWGSSMDAKWPKRFTVVALLAGMVVALATTSGGMSRVGLIIFAQALTIVGGPILALSLLYVARLPLVRTRAAIPAWTLVVASLGGLVTLALAIRTGWRIYLQFVA